MEAELMPDSVPDWPDVLLPDWPDMLEPDWPDVPEVLPVLEPEPYELLELSLLDSQVPVTSTFSPTWLFSCASALVLPLRYTLPLGLLLLLLLLLLLEDPVVPSVSLPLMLPFPDSLTLVNMKLSAVVPDCRQPMSFSAFDELGWSYGLLDWPDIVPDWPD